MDADVLKSTMVGCSRWDGAYVVKRRLSVEVRAFSEANFRVCGVTVAYVFWGHGEPCKSDTPDDYSKRIISTCTSVPYSVRTTKDFKQNRTARANVRPTVELLG